jgi:hypothetical protein
MSKRAKTTVLGLCLSALALGLGPAPALALPELEVQVQRDTQEGEFETVSRSDERVDYTLAVANVAPAIATAPEVGSKLFCDGAEPPLGTKNWSGSGAGNVYSFSFQWARDGVALESGEDIAAGAQTPTYTLRAADEGAGLQCLVTGANQTGTGAFTVASQPVFVLGPAPVPALPEPNNTTGFDRRPAISGPLQPGTETAGEWKAGEELKCEAPLAGWGDFGTATMSSGSNTLTDLVAVNGAGTLSSGSTAISGVSRVGASANMSAGSTTLSAVRTASGAGTLSSGSTAVTGLSTTSRSFLAGQEVSGEGIPAGTTIVSVGAEALTLSAPATASGTKSLSAGALPFAKGQTIWGAGIPAGTTIAAVSGQTITLSAPATASGTGVSVSGPDQSFSVGQEIGGEGIPAGTTIAASTANTITLSAPATASGPKRLSAGAQPFAVGDEVSGEGIPAGTTIESLSGKSATLSAPATASGAGVAVSSSPEWSFQWIRDGEPAPGATSAPTATTSRYELTAADVSAPQAPAVFQCLAKASNASGAALVESIWAFTTAPAPEFEFPGNPGFRPFQIVSQVPTVEAAGNGTSGEVTAELELPGGGTFAFRAEGSGWGCSRQAPEGAEPAKAICTREDPLAPESAYPPIAVIAGLRAETPDPAVARATASGGGAPEETSDEVQFGFEPAIPFGLEAFEAKVLDEAEGDYTQAGGHPYTGVGEFVLTKKRKLAPANALAPSKYAPIGNVRQVFTEIPRGFTGNPLAVPELCPTLEDVVAKPTTCPPGSKVGAVRTVFDEGTVGTLPIFAIEPEAGTPAQFAFPDPLGNVYTLTARLRPKDGYAVTLELAPSPVVGILEATATLCGFGVKSGALEFEGCKEKDEAGANEIPLLTNPTRCGSPSPVTRARLDSWQDPGDFAVSEFVNAEITGCEKVEFEPEIELAPTSHQADSPTGLEVEVRMPTEGLEDPDGIAQAHLKSVRVRFPEGMAVNPSAGHGLASCSAEQVGFGTNDPVSCPAAAKVGTMQIETPILNNTLEGAVYVARQGEVDGALLGLYMVFESKRDGIVVKIPGRVEPDPVTGQLTTVIDQSPEAPFSAARIDFPQGPRAPLMNPPKCGNYAIEAELGPWTGGKAVSEKDLFQVNRGPGGGPCPRGELEPKLSGGAAAPLAGRTSPFELRLHREDGTQRFSALKLSLPPGLTAYLKGVPYCPDGTLASIPAAPGTGQGEIDSPSCPAASQIGSVAAGAGPGANPFYVDDARAYLAGPYKGAPLSIAVVAPAVAGPLDLGNVVVRNAAYLDPKTAQVSVVSDPVPRILHGLLLDIRDIRVSIDRPDFTLNPTSCEPLELGAEVSGEAGAPAALSIPFQVGRCADLGFRSRLFLRLFGGTRRGANPKLRGVLTAGPGQANISRTAVTIPRSGFLDQAHIRTICTRVQFAADACPKGSIYGYARAFTPLLDYPVQGPVYLRSSDNKLPDMVVAVRGPAHQPIEAEVVGRIDSIRGQIRATFEAMPDVPLTKVILTMQGGKKGLLVNSRNICAGRNRATVRFNAHSGKTRTLRPVLNNSRCKKQRRGKKKR